MFVHNLVKPLDVHQITDDNGKRRYVTPEGHAYESVTTYLDRVMSKKALIEWQRKVGKKKAAEVKKAASTRGTSLHTIVETFIRNEEIDFKNDARNQVRFLKVQGPLQTNFNNIRLIESPLYSDELQLAGKPDMIGEWTGELSVVDLKTSSRAKKREWIISYFLQAACYGVMFNERYGEMPKKAVILMASETVNQAQLFIEPMPVCIGMLKNFMKDPDLFQRRMEIYKP